MNNKKRNNSIENQNRGEKKPINPNIQSKQSNNNSKIGNRNGNKIRWMQGKIVTQIILDTRIIRKTIKTLGKYQ